MNKLEKQAMYGGKNVGRTKLGHKKPKSPINQKKKIPQAAVSKWHVIITSLPNGDATLIQIFLKDNFF